MSIFNSITSGSDSQKKIADKVYTLIDNKARSNTFIQALSGLAGWPWTTVVDVSVVVTHYGPMLNDIRKMYGRSPLSSDAIVPILKGCSSELLIDFAIDKVIGQIPIIGFGANMICAKAMTWRLGILFAMLSSRGEQIDIENVRNATILIREVFPQKSSLHFEKPSKSDLIVLLRKVANESVHSFNETLELIRRTIKDSPTISLADM